MAIQYSDELEETEVVPKQPVRRSSTSARRKVARSRSRASGKSRSSSTDHDGMHRRGSRRRSR